MGFWDHLTIATVLAMQDYEQDMERQRQNKPTFHQQCKEEIGNHASALGDFISDLLTKAYHNHIADEAIQGMKLLAPYGFYQVLRAQGGMPTAEQRSVIDAYGRNIPTIVPMLTLLTASQRDGSERQVLENLMGISNDRAGAFWRRVFDAIHITGNAEESISGIVDHYCAIVTYYACLGQSANNVANDICKDFIDALHRQYTASPAPSFRKDAAWLEHKQAMERVALDLDQRARRDDDISMEELLTSLYRVLLYDLTMGAKGSILDKMIILDKMLIRCEVKHDLSGQQIYDCMRSGDMIAEMLIATRENIVGIIAMYGMRSGRVDDMAVFLKECREFLSGVEQEMAFRWPNHGFGSMSNGIVKSLYDAFQNGLQ